MAIPARLPIAADRAGPCVRRIRLVGLDLTGQTLAAEIRIAPDTPGAPLLSLPDVAAGSTADGVRLVAVTWTGGVPTTEIAIHIGRDTMRDPTRMRYSGRVGGASQLAYGLVAIANGVETSLLTGSFVVLPTVYGSTNAPASRAAGAPAGADGIGWDSAAVDYRGDGVPTVVLSGIDLFKPLLAAVTEAVDIATGAATRAQTAAAESAVVLFVPGLAGGTIDADGHVAGAVDDHGQTVPSPAGVIAYDDGAPGARDVLLMAADGRAARVTYAEGDNRAPTMRDGRLAWVSGLATYRTRSLSVVPSAPGATRLRHVVVHGQSNSLGWGGGADLVPLDPLRALMFPGGLHLNAPYIEPGTPVPGVSDAQLARMLPLRESAGTGQAAGGIGARIARALLSDTTAVLVSGHGLGGRSHVDLGPGTMPWANLRRALVAGRLQAWRAGMEYEATGLAWVQGEDDFSASEDAYFAALLALHTVWEADVRAVTLADTVPGRMVIAQPSSWTGYGAQAATSGVPLAQMRAMLARPDRIAVACAFYALPHLADGVHLSPAGSQFLDALLGRSLARRAAGGAGAGLHAVSAARTGVTVTVQVTGGDGSALAIDTAAVSDPGQLGLVYRRTGDGAPVAVSGVRVAGQQITLTLASAVPGTLGFGLEGAPGARAGPGTGPRCCIRNTCTDSGPTGAPLHDWMLHHAIDVA